MDRGGLKQEMGGLRGWWDFAYKNIWRGLVERDAKVENDALLDTRVPPGIIGGNFAC